MALIATSDLLSLKPVIYAANTDEEGFTHLDANPYYQQVKAIADAEGRPGAAHLRPDGAGTSPSWRARRSRCSWRRLGVSESGLDRLIKCSYTLLGLISFLTYGKDECRAWTIKKGTKAPQAAGKIHTGHRAGLHPGPRSSPMRIWSSAAAWPPPGEKGLLRSEGKEYVVQDGDMIYFPVQCVMTDQERLAAYDRMYADLLAERDKVAADHGQAPLRGAKPGRILPAAAGPEADGAEPDRPVRDLRHQRGMNSRQALKAPCLFSVRRLERSPHGGKHFGAFRRVWSERRFSDERKEALHGRVRDPAAQCHGASRLRRVPAGLCAGLQSIPDAEDVYQDVFLRLLDQDTSDWDEEHLRAWLLRCAVNRCCDLHRFRLRRPVLALEGPAGHGGAGQRRRGAVGTRWPACREKLRVPIHLYYAEGVFHGGDRRTAGYSGGHGPHPAPPGPEPTERHAGRRRP